MNFKAFRAQAMAEFGLGMLMNILLQDFPMALIIADFFAEGTDWQKTAQVFDLRKGFLQFRDIDSRTDQVFGLVIIADNDCDGPNHHIFPAITAGNSAAVFQRWLVDAKFFKNTLESEHFALGQNHIPDKNAKQVDNSVSGKLFKGVVDADETVLRIQQYHQGASGLQNGRNKISFFLQQIFRPRFPGKSGDDQEKPLEFINYQPH